MKWYQRKCFKVLLLIHIVLFVVLIPPAYAWVRGWVLTDSAQPTWEGPLTADQRKQTFDFLWQQVDRRYSYLEIKQIDWKATGDRFWPMAEAAPDDAAFYDVLQQMLATLRDGHTELLSWPGSPKLAGPGVGTAWVEGQPVVTRSSVGGVKPGDALVTVDGRPWQAVADEMRVRTSASTEVEMQTEIGGWILVGKKETLVQAGFRRPDGSAYEVGLPRPPNAPAPAPAARQPIVAKQVEEFGYIAIRDLWEADVVTGFDAALEQYRAAPGLILDLRGNGGGSDTFAQQIAGRLLSAGTPWARIQMRFYPFWTPRISRNISPRGPWQYTGPVVLLIDGGVFSSTDFLVGGLARSGRAVTVGSPTGGGDGNPARITLPGGAQVRISRWIEWFTDGTVVEGNGTQPDYPVSRTIADVVSGRDPVLEKAVEVLRSRR